VNRPLLVLGTSDFSLVVADIAEDAGFQVAGFVENLDRTNVASGHDGRPVTWFEDLPAMAGTHDVVCGLGTTRRFIFIEQALGLGMRFVTVVHPSATVSSRAEVGAGSVLSPGCVVAAYSSLGAHVLLNRGAMVGHHTRVGDYTSIHSGAQVASSCNIGRSTWIGIGAVISDHTRVGQGSVVGAGAVVINDIADRVTVVGVPARVVREGSELK
jgi:acetyltransferase EpsM